MSRRVVPGSPVHAAQLAIGGFDASAPSGAVFSDDLRYRYRLRRPIGPSLSRALFVMLNPSAADEIADDPTIRRCIGFARAWGFGELLVGNIFALRATDPRLLYSDADPVGPANDEHLLAMARAAGRVVVAWGTHGAHLDRGTRVLELLRADGVKPMALGLTKDGFPRHPLYLRADAELVEVRP